MLTALLAAAPALLELLEAGVSFVQNSVAHSDAEKTAVLAEIEQRLAATLVKVQAAKPRQVLP